MDKATGHKVKLGIFVTIGFILLTTGVYFIGEKQNMFSTNFQLKTIFRNVSGLQPGNNVRFSGINVGTVGELNIINDSTIEVVMVIEEGVRPYIKKDAIASIGSDGLVGSMLVNISPGNGELANVENNDLIVSYSRIKAEDMISTLSSTNENIALLTSDLLRITESIINGKGAVGTLLYDSTLAMEIRLTVDNLKETTSYTKKVTQKFSQLATHIQNDRNMISLLTKDTTLTTNIGRMMTNLEESSKSMKEVSHELSAVMAKLEHTDGALGALLNDPELATNLKQTMENINLGTSRFNENMEAIRHNFLFRRYFKKQQKEADNPEEALTSEQ